jgi:outer membrane biosynthesis protein TonB
MQNSFEVFSYHSCFSLGYRSMNTKLALSALVAALMLTACAKQEAASPDAASTPPATTEAAPAAPAGDAAAPAAPAADAPAAPADAGSAAPPPADAPAAPPKQ